MDSIDSSKNLSFTNEELNSANQWSLDEWRLNILNVSRDQMARIIPLINSTNDPDSWKDKIHIVVTTFNTLEQLESFSRASSFEQIYEAISWIIDNKDKNQAKFYPLFVGMSHENFLMLLLHGSGDHVAVLKQESISEPVQHHLTLLTHTLTSALEIQNQLFNNLERQIGALDKTSIDSDLIDNLNAGIQALLNSCKGTELVTSKALLLAWNSNRSDLIEKLSQIKEHAQKLEKLGVGQPKSSDALSTGLYTLIDKALDNVFRDEQGEVIDDNEPALEALVQFSIWYIKDYWEVGLLPHINDAQELELDYSSATEAEQIKHRTVLFETVKNNLEKIGLKTLKDLKENQIYSKAALEIYIKRNLNAF